MPAILSRALSYQADRFSKHATVLFHSQPFGSATVPYYLNYHSCTHTTLRVVRHFDSWIFCTKFNLLATQGYDTEYIADLLPRFAWLRQVVFNNNDHVDDSICEVLLSIPTLEAVRFMNCRRISPAAYVRLLEHPRERLRSCVAAWIMELTWPKRDTSGAGGGAGGAAAATVNNNAQNRFADRRVDPRFRDGAVSAGAIPALAALLERSVESIGSWLSYMEAARRLCMDSDRVSGEDYMVLLDALAMQLRSKRAELKNKACEVLRSLCRRSALVTGIAIATPHLLERAMEILCVGKFAKKTTTTASAGTSNTASGRPAAALLNAAAITRPDPTLLTAEQRARNAAIDALLHMAAISGENSSTSNPQDGSSGRQHCFNRNDFHTARKASSGEASCCTGSQMWALGVVTDMCIALCHEPSEDVLKRNLRVLQTLPAEFLVDYLSDDEGVDEESPANAGGGGGGAAAAAAAAAGFGVAGVAAGAQLAAVQAQLNNAIAAIQNAVGAIVNAGQVGGGGVGVQVQVAGAPPGIGAAAGLQQQILAALPGGGAGAAGPAGNARAPARRHARLTYTAERMHRHRLRDMRLLHKAGLLHFVAEFVNTGEYHREGASWRASVWRSVGRAAALCLKEEMMALGLVRAALQSAANDADETVRICSLEAAASFALSRSGYTAGAEERAFVASLESVRAAAAFSAVDAMLELQCLDDATRREEQRAAAMASGIVGGGGGAAGRDARRERLLRREQRREKRWLERRQQELEARMGGDDEDGAARGQSSGRGSDAGGSSSEYFDFDVNGLDDGDEDSSSDPDGDDDAEDDDSDEVLQDDDEEDDEEEEGDDDEDDDEDDDHDDGANANSNSNGLGGASTNTNADTASRQLLSAVELDDNQMFQQTPQVMPLVHQPKKKQHPTLSRCSIAASHGSEQSLDRALQRTAWSSQASLVDDASAVATATTVMSSSAQQQRDQAVAQDLALAIRGERLAERRKFIDTQRRYYAHKQKNAQLTVATILKYATHFVECGGLESAARQLRIFAASGKHGEAQFNYAAQCLNLRAEAPLPRLPSAMAADTDACERVLAVRQIVRLLADAAAAETHAEEVARLVAVRERHFKAAEREQRQLEQDHLRRRLFLGDSVVFRDDSDGGECPNAAAAATTVAAHAGDDAAHVTELLATTSATSPNNNTSAGSGGKRSAGNIFAAWRRTRGDDENDGAAGAALATPFTDFICDREIARVLIAVNRNLISLLPLQLCIKS